MVILFAAGNGGIDLDANGVIDPDSIDSPGTAKNCITMGATEGYRPVGGASGTYGNYWPSDYPVSPIYDDQVADSAVGMAAFSGRGPCNDGRLKPDICAPGTNIISCRSHAVTAGVLWGVYNADYLYSGGTSMSTPLTAGAAALVREYYRTHRSHTPSAALIKATLINGACEIYPGQYGSGTWREIPTLRPNNAEGWGRLDLKSSVMPDTPRTVEFQDIGAGLSTGQSLFYSYPVLGSAPFKVTLVWTDYPASTSAQKALVNDLDLTVRLPDGSVISGNGTTDRLNNVEGVDVEMPAIGTYTVTVNAYNVPSGPQPFALVVSGVFGSPAPTADITAPATGTSLFGSITVRGTASGPDFEQYTLEYGAGTNPSIWTPIIPPQTTPVTSGVLGVWNTSGLADGPYTIRLTARNTGGATAADSAVINLLSTRISQVKAAGDGGAVTLTGKVVSADRTDFGTFMYIQEPDRSSGIRVTLGSLQTDASRGDFVTVTGTVATLNGERTITNPSVIVTGSAAVPRPLAVNNRAVGGSALNPHTPGITEGLGLNNIGLLVRVFGRVTEAGTDWFYIDDGTGRLHAGHVGIKVAAPTLGKPAVGQYAVVTGISSAEVDGSAAVSVVRPRAQDDLTYY
jgi:hypothetical protein